MFYSCSGTVASLAGIPEEKVSIEVRNYNVKNKCFLVQPLELNVLRLIFYNIFKFSGAKRGIKYSYIIFLRAILVRVSAKKCYKYSLGLLDNANHNICQNIRQNPTYLTSICYLYLLYKYFF